MPKGRPKKYRNPIQKTITIEKDVEEFFEQNPEMEYGKALQEWMRAQIPIGQSAVEYLLVSLQKQIEFKESEKAEAIRRIEEEFNKDIEELKRNRELIRGKNAGKDDKIRELWQKWKEEIPYLQRGPTWKGDMEEHYWWRRNGMPMTFNDLWHLWEEMEGPDET